MNIDTESRHYERTKTGKVYTLVKESNIDGNVVLCDANGNEFAISPGVLGELYVAVDGENYERD